MPCHLPARGGRVTFTQIAGSVLVLVRGLHILCPPPTLFLSPSGDTRRDRSERRTRVTNREYWIAFGPRSVSDGGPVDHPSPASDMRGDLRQLLATVQKVTMTNEQDNQPKDAPAGDSVTLEQLQYLLGLGTETQALDFKRDCNVDDRRAIVELAKDVGAMQIEGCYIVVGAESDGTPVPPGVADKDRQKFDEANLRPKLARYVPQPFELRTAIHTIGDCTFAIIRVPPRPDGFCVFAADGIYKEDGKDVFVFRKGDVFARHGTTNERWNQADIDRIRQRMVSSLKESWWAEREEDQHRREAITRGAAQVVTAPLANYTWHVDVETFEAATLELFRANDDIPLRRLLNEAAADASALADSGDIDELTTIVGRVVSIAALAITYKRPEWFNEALDTLARIYHTGFDARGFDRAEGTSPDVWLVVLEHLLALGALATRKRDWAAVRALAATPPGGASEFYASWLRHALTMAARSSRLDDAKALVTRSAERVAALPSLRPDISASDDRVITSICQFDFLAVLTIIAETHDLSGAGWYPNFARFNTTRSEPAADQLIADEAMRAILFPLSDAELAGALREVDRRSRSEGARFAGWDGFSSDKIANFLNANPAPRSA